MHLKPNLEKGPFYAGGKNKGGGGSLCRGEKSQIFAFVLI